MKSYFHNPLPKHRADTDDQRCVVENIKYLICFQGSICEGYGYISFVVIFSFLYNVTKFMEFQTVYEEDDDG